MVVPGREAATVEDMYTALAAALGVDAARLLAISCTTNNATQRLQVTSPTDPGAPAILIKDFQIFPGEEIVVEVIPEGISRDSTDYASPAVAALELRRKAAIIFFNNPENTTASSTATGGATENNNENSAVEYPMQLEVSLDTPLLQVKERIAAALSISDIESFHLKRSAHAPQFKDESKTLLDLAINSNGILHVQVRIYDNLFPLLCYIINIYT